MASAGPENGAIVFDCDGVLVDSEEAWTRAEAKLFARHGLPYGVEEKRHMVGMSMPETGRILEEWFGRPGGAEAILGELVELAAIEFGRGVRALPGARELLDDLDGRRPVAVASNSPRRLVAQALRGAGLWEPFEVVVSGEEVLRPKPAPDLYLEACRRLGVAPAGATAVEDSPRGVASARAAGLYVIGIPHVPGLDLDADLVAESLEDRQVRSVLGLPG